jgi:hypothetical protein
LAIVREGLSHEFAGRIEAMKAEFRTALAGDE